MCLVATVLDSVYSKHFPYGRNFYWTTPLSRQRGGPEFSNFLGILFAFVVNIKDYFLF